MGAHRDRRNLPRNRSGWAGVGAFARVLGSDGANLVIGGMFSGVFTPKEAAPRGRI